MSFNSEYMNIYTYAQTIYFCIGITILYLSRYHRFHLISSLSNHDLQIHQDTWDSQHV